MHRTTKFTTTYAFIASTSFHWCSQVLVRDDVNFLHTDHRQTDMSHSVNVASVIKFYWLIFYSNGSNRTKRGARESGPGSRIQQFGSILEPQIRFRAARARNLRYRAQAVPCILDKIVDTNGPVGSYLRFRSSGGDALLRVHICVPLMNTVRYSEYLPVVGTCY